MSLSDLQNALYNEMQVMLADYRVKDETNNPSPSNFYRGKVPLRTSDEDPSYIPYILVRVREGIVPESQSDNSTAKAVIVIAVYDDGADYVVENDVLSVIQRIIERFSKDALLGDKYNFTGRMEWALSDEDTYPYQFGGVEIEFTLPTIVKEDDYS